MYAFLDKISIMLGKKTSNNLGKTRRLPSKHLREIIN